MGELGKMQFIKILIEMLEIAHIWINIMEV